jgi:hypothetical protein
LPHQFLQDALHRLTARALVSAARRQLREDQSGSAPRDFRFAVRSGALVVYGRAGRPRAALGNRARRCSGLRPRLADRLGFRLG